MKFLALAISAIFLTSCNNPPKAVLSPGPSGGVVNGDYRVPTTYLTTPHADLTPGNYTRKIGERYYELHVPTGYDASQHLPVMLVLHGGGGYASVARYQTGMDAVADKNGFLVLYGAGTGSSGWDRLLYWNSKAEAGKADDVAYIAKVLDDVQQFARIDSKRVYACGMSNGAQMTCLLTSRLRDRVAAFGAVAAANAPNQLSPTPKPSPIIQFHGDADKFAPYFPIPLVIEGWAKLNGCAGTPPAKPGDGSLVYSCDVTHWKIVGGGHTWPGGKLTKLEENLGVGKLDPNVPASQLIWDFCKKHRLP